MSLDNQDKQEVVPRTLVQKITRNTYSDWESEKQLEVHNIECTIQWWAYQFFAERNNHLVLVKDKIDPNMDIKVVKFVPWDESDYLEVVIEWETFKWEIGYSNKNKFLAVYSESPHVKPWVIIHAPTKIWTGFNKVTIDDKNIEKYRYRKLVFTSIEFSNEDCYLWSYDKKWFHEVSDTQSSGSFYKYAVTAILSGVIWYSANNLSVTSNDIQNFASETRQSVTNTLSTEEEKTFSIAASKAWYIRQLESYDITDFDASKFPKEWAKAGDKLFITYSGDKLIKMINQRWEIIYAL